MFQSAPPIPALLYTPYVSGRPVADHPPADNEVAVVDGPDGAVQVLRRGVLGLADLGVGDQGLDGAVEGEKERESEVEGKRHYAHYWLRTTSITVG